jgi:Fe-S cluster assembly ATP-binding protein
MLSITDLHADIDGTPILKGITLEVPAGQVHAIMGPNGSGKSTLSKVIAGHPSYAVTRGSIAFKGADLLPLEPEARAQAGVFMSFQYPVEVPGVNNADFLRLAYNAQRKARGEKELKAAEFAPILEAKYRAVDMDPALKDRQLNSGFSGGQKKRNEILQMVVLEPSLAILDETDSGLDIDALRIVAAGINAYRRADRAIILITHYQRLLELVVPDRVHVLSGGRIVESGGPELARSIEERGFETAKRAP